MKAIIELIYPDNQFDGKKLLTTDTNKKPPQNEGKPGPVRYRIYRVEGDGIVPVINPEEYKRLPARSHDSANRQSGQNGAGSAQVS